MTEIVKKKRWDKVVVVIGIIIGFSITMMKITDYWPCDIINMLSGSQLC